ncbi:MAG: glycosyltransferase, partial [Actinomycetota bacterium]
ESKGLAEFLRLAPRPILDSLVVIGEGDDLERCRNVVRSRGATTAFLGRLTHEQTLLELQRSTVALLPSRWAEIQPLSVLEAQAMGLRLLTSDLGGLKELSQRDPLSAAFDPFDADAVRRACEIVLSADDAARTRRRPAFLDDHDPDTYVASVLREYSGAVSCTR